MINFNRICDDYTEIVARYIDAEEQMKEWPKIQVDHDQWIEKYNNSDLSNNSVQFNIFRNKVQAIVGQLMFALQREIDND